MTQYTLFILVTVLLVTTSSWAQMPPHPVTFIPTLYVTSAPERPGPTQVFAYQANICNTSVYAGKMVIARVNIPLGWNPGIGVLAKLQVCSTAACSKPLCTNFPQGTFNGQHNCTFAYNTTMTAIFLVVTAGNANYIIWTAALEFLSKSEYLKRAKEASFVEYVDIPEPIATNEIYYTDVKILQQIIPPGIHFSVTTLNRQDYKLSFCPDAQTTQRYTVQIVVTALDSRSAMATYICLPPVDPAVGCTPGDSTHSDPRGIAINTVTVGTGSGSLKDIYVAVVGWGDGNIDNHFLLGATVTRD